MRPLTTNRRIARALSKALMIPTLFCVGAALPSNADVVLTLDDAPAGGVVTLAEGADTVTLTDAEGKAKQIKLIDLDEVRFGEDLVILRGGDLLLIDNGKAGTSRRAAGKIKLRAGLHRFVVPYFQDTGAHSLSLKVAGPGIPGEIELNGERLRCLRDADEAVEPSPGIDERGYRLPELATEAGDDRRRFLSRARYRYYVGDDTMRFGNVGVLSRMTLKRSGTTTAIDTGLVTDPQTHLGLVFEGFFRAEKDGEYTFALTSDDGSQLYFGDVDRFQADQLGNIDAGPTPWRAELEDGGVARGELTAMADGTLTMKLALGDEAHAEVTLSAAHANALWDTRVEPEQINRDKEPADEDSAYIRDRDEPDQIRSVTGKVVGLDAESLTFTFKGRERKIDRARVVGLVLAHPDRPDPPRTGFHQVLRLRTGQVLPGRVVSIGDRVALDMIGGGTLDMPRDAVIQLRNVNGRRVDLTRIDPTAEEAIPYFGLAIPMRLNQAFSGEPIRLYDEQTYERGLAVHSKSRLHYKLDRPAETFRARFGLLEPGGKLGDVTARVLGDGEVLWEQAGITAKTEAVEVEVGLEGVKRLVLEVDFGQGQNVGDRAAWCNPQLIYAESE